MLFYNNFKTEKGINLVNETVFVNSGFFCEWKLLAAFSVACMNQYAPVMSLNETGFIRFINERSAAGKDLTYFTENKKAIEDKRRGANNRYFHWPTSVVFSNTP